MPYILGIPIKLLHEAQGHVVSCELKTGDLYRGKLLDVEDNMNVQMQNVVRTDRLGRTSELEQVFIRGGQIRFFVIPDMLKNAPMFKNQALKLKGESVGVGMSGVGKTATLRKFIDGGKR